jgi:DNA-binding NarL/FixJ family response regulator
MIVDDSADFVSAARDLLERQGLDVVGVASTGDEALANAREARPDVALIDIDLGEESGLDLAERLSGTAGLEELPLVLISTYSEKDFVDVVATSPAVGFLTKSTLSASAIRRLLGEAAADTGSAT